MKQEIKKWVETQSGQFFSTSLLTIQDKLEPGVYELNNVLGTDLALTRISEGFPVYGKIYDLQDDFINRCVRSFQNSSRCMGVILHGPKGTGKTITAEQIAMRLNMPIILITSKSRHLVGGLTTLTQPCVILVDEAEKIFNKYDKEKEIDVKTLILSILDGALSPNNKLLFLFTANELFDFDRLLIDRPGRIRYTKEFKSLGVDEILEVVEDLLDARLKNEDFKKDLIETFAQIELITIDILKAVIEECNLFGQKFSEFVDVFNVGHETTNKERYNITLTNMTTKKVQNVTSTRVHPEYPFTPLSEDNYFEIDGYIKGNVKEFLAPNQLVLKTNYDGEEVLVTVTHEPYINASIAKILAL